MFAWNHRNYAGLSLSGGVLIILAFAQGCSTVPAHIAAPLPPANMADHAALATGRKIYVSMFRCALCHRPKQVSDYTAETWADDILPRMSKKARLSPEEYADVLAYVTSTTEEISSLKELGQ